MFFSCIFDGVDIFLEWSEGIWIDFCPKGDEVGTDDLQYGLFYIFVSVIESEYAAESVDHGRDMRRAEGSFRVESGDRTEKGSVVICVDIGVHPYLCGSEVVTEFAVMDVASKPDVEVAIDDGFFAFFPIFCDSLGEYSRVEVVFLVDGERICGLGGNGVHT